MKYTYVEQLKVVREDYTAARAALEFVEQAWERLQNEPFARGLRLRQIMRSLARLEATHIIRLFAEFEGILRAYLAISRPHRRLRRTPTEVLINSVALRLHIPDPIRDAAHTVRLYRNFLVHPDGEEIDTVGFAQAVSFLNHFLVWLPSPP